jgi:hypothetical protein
MTPLTYQRRQEIEKEIFAGRKISAIKLYREVTGVELADAKNAVDDMEVDLRRQYPERFVGKARSGCMSVVACVGIVGALAIMLKYLI